MLWCTMCTMSMMRDVCNVAMSPSSNAMSICIGMYQAFRAKQRDTIPPCLYRPNLQ